MNLMKKNNNNNKNVI